MITHRMTGTGANAGGAIVNIMGNSLRTILTSFDNVHFVKNIITSNNTARYIYSVDGFDNYYIAFENSSASNTYMYVAVFLRGTEESTLGSAVFSSMDLGGDTSIIDDLYITTKICHTFSKNNKLYGIVFNFNDDVPHYYLLFNIQNSGNYICQNENVAYEISGGYKCCINRYYPNCTYAVNEKAVKVKPMLTNNNSTSAYALIDILEHLHKFINSAFNNHGFQLIEVDGVRYRQIYQYCLFIEDGDEEEGL